MLFEHAFAANGAAKNRNRFMPACRHGCCALLLDHAGDTFSSTGMGFSRFLYRCSSACIFPVQRRRFRQVLARASQAGWGSSLGPLYPAFPFLAPAPPPAISAVLLGTGNLVIRRTGRLLCSRSYLNSQV